mmetsp:Transcript_16761/g.39505  ORF Transcript_16761/g.39505 Transcript_16761/m.39505 type:complete len:329 (+) Transcript_16761:637-1623(+)
MVTTTTKWTCGALDACFFEIVSLYPLFPGTNEADQIQKIHNILGTPGQAILDRFKRHATHIDFNFAHKEGTGVTKLIPHASQECIELIIKLLEYNPEDRLSARQALRHPYFRDMRDSEKRSKRVSPRESPVASVPDGGTRSSAGSSTKGSIMSRSAVQAVTGKPEDDHHDGKKKAAEPAKHGSSHNGGGPGHALPSIPNHRKEYGKDAHSTDHAASLPGASHHGHHSESGHHNFDVAAQSFPDIKPSLRMPQLMAESKQSTFRSYKTYNKKHHYHSGNRKKENTSSRLADAYSGASASSQYPQAGRRAGGLPNAGNKVIPPLGSVRRQ